ncbi:ABC transporter permease [Halostella sp. JP-L12]|uniref:ABC transporter permease n=1 Tax=Halostella TaxID=1843185 RepID=UPI000EF7FD9D|nr:MULTISPECIES: ABC transporter permease [Halostella]NHN46148.1 ABC transporter permease [Halostella sp. JP-L12]
MSQHTTADDDDAPLLDRIRENPQPAIRWAAVAAVLLALQIGAVFGATMELPPWDTLAGYVLGVPLLGALEPAFAAIASAGDRLAEIPTLLSRDLIPNRGHRVAGGPVFEMAIGGFEIVYWEWSGTFLGLPAAVAWFIRVALVYLYAFVWLAWLWKAYLVFRENYRYADWTPTDDIIDRMRTHRWGQFGFVIITMFVVMALFAPTLGPTTFDENINKPYSHELEYLDKETGEVETTLVGNANLQSRSLGNADSNFGLVSYDSYDRFHPFGTLQNGKDLFTFIALGSRVSLFIGIVAIGISSAIAFALAMVSAYYKGAIDLASVLLSDSIQAMPRLLVLIGAAVLLRGTWIADVYNGGFLLALLFGGWGWPGLWRAVRGPSFQVVEREWVDAARSYGQTPRRIMQKHMAPYVVGYLLIYASMNLGGIIIGTSALSFLGLGITPPTPEWGRAINMGQEYVATSSWHISMIPGILIVIVVTGFNALGDGIRDAIDPQSESSGASGESAAAGGGA